MKERCENYYDEIMRENNKQKESLSREAERIRRLESNFNASMGITAKERIIMKIIFAYACITTLITGLFNKYLIRSVSNCFDGSRLFIQAFLAVLRDFWETENYEWSGITNGIAGPVISTILLTIIVSLFVLIVVKGLQIVLKWWHEYYQRNMNDYISNVVALGDLIIVVYLGDVICKMWNVNLVLLYAVVLILYIGIR